MVLTQNVFNDVHYMAYVVTEAVSIEFSFYILFYTKSYL